MSRCAPPAPATTSRRSGWRHLQPEVARAPVAERRPRGARSPSRRARVRSGSGTSGQPARWIERRPGRGRGSARGARSGTASPARPRAATARARTRASGTRPRRRRRSGGASGGCTSSRGRRRTPRTRGSRRPSASPRTPAVASCTNWCVRSTSQRSSGRSAGGPGLEVGERRREALDVRVGDEERRPSSRA